MDLARFSVQTTFFVHEPRRSCKIFSPVYLTFVQMAFVLDKLEIIIVRTSRTKLALLNAKKRLPNAKPKKRVLLFTQQFLLR